MKNLESYVQDRWHEAGGGWVPLIDPCTEEAIANASSVGIDFGAVLAHARDTGGFGLRELTFAQRGTLLAAMSTALQGCRDALIGL